MYTLPWQTALQCLSIIQRLLFWRKVHIHVYMYKQWGGWIIKVNEKLGLAQNNFKYGIGVLVFQCVRAAQCSSEREIMIHVLSWMCCGAGYSHLDIETMLQKWISPLDLPTPEFSCKLTLCCTLTCVCVWVCEVHVCCIKCDVCMCVSVWSMLYKVCSTGTQFLEVWEREWLF